MVTKELTIINKLGIHARPAAQFVNLASNLMQTLSWRRMARKLTARAFWV